MENIGIVFLSILLPALLLWLVLERSLLPGKSTKAYWGLSHLPFPKKLEGYLYAARTAWYLKPATWPWIIHFIRNRESPDTYHGKIVSKQDAKRLINLQKPVMMTDLEHVIPYRVARDIILKETSVAVMRCPCRAQKKDSCQPDDVCLIIGEPFVSFVVDHQPSQARKIEVPEALAVIEAEEKRGHVHTAWFKDVMHNRFYAICNCCRCCCLGMASFTRGVKRLAHAGYRPIIDRDSCGGCGICQSICPFNAVSVYDDFPVTDMEKCMGCGLCVSHCPYHALNLTLAPDKGTPLNLEQLTPQS